MTLKLSDCPYADEIKRAMEAYLPLWPWLYGVAQLYQESHWAPSAENARSGAMGIAQFMPPTWNEAVDKMGFIDIASPYDPIYAIPAYAWYMRNLSQQWSSKRSDVDRRKLTQASYNCGIGNMFKAQRLAKGATDYDSIIAKLPQVTGIANAAETTDYVAKIERWYQELATSETQP